jgi:hypothetical protein
MPLCGPNTDVRDVVLELLSMMPMMVQVQTSKSAADAKDDAESQENGDDSVSHD